jgi:hypothetical protein
MGRKQRITAGHLGSYVVVTSYWFQTRRELSTEELHRVLDDVSEDMEEGRQSEEGDRQPCRGHRIQE